MEAACYGSRELGIVLLTSSADHVRKRKRVETTEKVFQLRGSTTLRLELKGNSELERTLWYLDARFCQFAGQNSSS